MPSLLIVTRERSDDRRYGLGKSLDPVLRSLRDQGMEILYLSQQDAGEGGRLFLARLQGRIVRWFGWIFRGSEFDALVGGVLERLNMGRLAAKVAFGRRQTHVHCHDPIIAAGYQWFRWYYGGYKAGRVRHGLTQHGFGSYTQALHEDGARLNGRLMAWLRRWERRILRRADWVLTPTAASLEQLARDLACYPIPEHWQVIPHARPGLTLTSRARARKTLGWSEDWFVVLGVGRNAPLKRFGDLIQACASFDEASLHLVLLGPGDDPTLRRLAREAGLPEHRLHLEASPEAGVYYSGADVYVSTSLTESFGLANLEALVAGLPVIATAVGGVPEVLGDGGWLIPPGQPAVLAEVIEKLWADGELREDLSRRAVSRARGWPDEHAVAARYLALYREGKTGEGRRWKMPQRKKLEEDRMEDLSVYPLPRPLSLSGDLRVLVFAPHPDDETLGVGGMLAGLAEMGARVKLVVVTEGERGDPARRFQAPTARVRQEELRQALAILGIDEHVQWKLPDGECVDDASLRGRIQAEIHAGRPDWLLVPSPLEIHRDHVAVARAVTHAWRRLGTPGRLFYYEVSQPVAATHVVDVTPWQKRKLQALQCYRLPLSYCDYSTLSTSLMAYRARCLAPGAESVEALLEMKPKESGRLMRSMASLRRHMEP